MLRSRFVAPLVVVAALFAAGLAFLYSVLAPAPGGDRGAAVAGASARGAVRPRSSPAPGTTAKPAKPPTPAAGPARPSRPTVTLPPGSAPKIAPSLVRDGESAKAEGPDFEAVFARGGMLFSRKPSGPGPRSDSPPSLAFRLTEVRRGGAVLHSAPPQSPALEVQGLRVVYRHSDSLVESFEVRADGVEQTLRLERAPEGAGDLFVRGALDTGLEPTRRGPDVGDITFVSKDTQEPLLCYGEACAIDAAGKRRPVATWIDREGLGLRLDEEWLSTATFPISIDPLFSTRVTIGAGHAPLALARNAGSNTFLAVYATNAGAPALLAVELGSDSHPVASPSQITLLPLGPNPDVRLVTSPSTGRHLLVYHEGSAYLTYTGAGLSKMIQGSSAIRAVVLNPNGTVFRPPATLLGTSLYYGMDAVLRTGPGDWQVQWYESGRTTPDLSSPFLVSWNTLYRGFYEADVASDGTVRAGPGFGQGAVFADALLGLVYDPVANKSQTLWTDGASMHATPGGALLGGLWESAAFIRSPRTGEFRMVAEYGYTSAPPPSNNYALSASGAGFSPAPRAAEGLGFLSPALAFAPAADRSLFAYRTTDPSQWGQIRVQELAADGSPDASETVQLPEGAQVPSSPAVIYDPVQRRYLVAWSIGSSIRAQLVTPTDHWVPPPLGLTATPGERQVSLAWGAPPIEDVKGYSVYRSLSANGPFVKVNATLLTGTSFVDVDPTSPSAPVTQVVFYYVEIEDFAGNRASSATISAQPYDHLAPATPAGVQATRGDSQVTVAWAAVGAPDLLSYRLWQRNADATYTLRATVSASTTTTVVTGLTNDTAYTFAVTARDSSLNESPRSADCSATPVDLTPPAVPAGLVVTPGDSSLTWAWSANTEVDLAGYNIYRSTTADGPFSLLNPSSLLTTPVYVDAPLTIGQAYWVRVAAVDTHSNPSAQSAAMSGVPLDLSPPAAPTGLAATPQDGAVLLAFNANSEPDLAGYRVERATSTNGPWTVLNPSALLTTTSYTATSLTNGTTYHFRARAVDASSNTGSPSASISARPFDSVAPAAPVGLSCAAGEGKNTLSWTANTETDWAGMRVLRSTSESGPFTELISVGPVTTLEDAGLTNDTTYWYKLQARDTSDNLSPEAGPISGAPHDQTPPAIPAGLHAVSSDRQVDCLWSPNVEGDLAGYNLDHATSANGPWTRLNASLLTQPSFVHAGLDNGTSHWYRVFAQDTHQNASGPAQIGPVVPRDDVAPAAVTGLTAQAGDRQVTLGWTQAAEVDLAGTNLYRATQSGGPFTKVNAALVTATSYVATGLVNGTRYWFVAKQQDTSENEGPASAPAVDAVPFDTVPPATPTGLCCVAGDQRNTVNWTLGGDYDLAAYRVLRALAESGPYAELASVGLTTSYVDANLTNGQAYYYKLQSRDTSSNLSPEAGPVTGSPHDLTPPAMPAGLTAEPSDRQVALAWIDGTETDRAGFWVERAAASTGPWTRLNSAILTSPSYTATGLTNGQNTWFQIFAADTSSNESTPAVIGPKVARDAVPPAAPVNLTVVESDQAVSLGWTAGGSDEDLAGFDLYRATQSQGPYVKHSASLITSAAYTATGLANGTRYFFVVKARDTSDNSSAASAECNARPFDTVPPGRPAAFSATAGDARVTISFAANTEPDLKSYRILRATSQNGEYSTVAQLASAAPWVDTTVTVDTEYWYEAVATDTSDNDSPPAGPLSATGFDHTAPAVPASVHATPHELSVSLDWSANTADADYVGVNVYRATSATGPFTKLNGTPVTGTTFDDLNQISLTPLHYQLRALDGHSNESGASETVNALPLNTLPPAIPTGLSVTPGDSRNALTFQTGGELDLAGVDVYRATSGGAFVKVNSAPISTGAFSDEGLINYTEYRYFVKAIDVAQNASGASAPVVVGMPIDLTPPPIPVGVAVVPGNRRAVVSWTAVSASDLAGIIVYRSTVAGEPGERVSGPDPVTGTSFTDLGLTNGVQYFWSAGSIDVHQNQSARSAQTTGIPRYPRPTGLARTAVGNQSVGLAWAPVAEPDLASYNAYRAPAPAGPWTLVNGTPILAPSYTDSTVPNGTWWFAVTAVSSNGDESLRSDPIIARPEDVLAPTLAGPMPPAPGDNTPVLHGQGLAGYRVELFEGAAPLGDTLVNATGSFAREVNSALNDGDHTLYARMSSTLEGGAISEQSNPVTVTVSTVPGDIAARAFGGRVAVTWQSNPASALAYHVYRTLIPGSAYLRVTSAPVHGTLLLDAGMPSGTYYYRVSAVNAQNSESAMSEEVEAVLDATPPTLLAVAPADGATDVPVDAPVTLSFSERIAAASANYDQSLFLVHAATGRIVDATVTWSEATATLTPAEPLDHEAFYQVAVTSHVTDLAGNPLVPASPALFQFRTAALDLGGWAAYGPRWSAVWYNDDPIQYVLEPMMPWTVFFTRPVDRATVTADRVKLQPLLDDAALGAPLPVKLDFGPDNQSIRVIPLAPLPDGRQAALTFSSEITDPYGHRLGTGSGMEPYDQIVWSPGDGVFPDASIPRVLSVRPGPGAEGVRDGEPVRLRFSEPVSAASVTGDTVRVLRASDGSPVAGSLALSDTGREVTFTPTDPWAPETHFQVEVTPAVLDLAGHALDQDPGTDGAQAFSSPFRTEAADAEGPVVVGLGPVFTGNQVLPDARPLVVFSEPIDPATVPGEGTNAGLEVTANGLLVSGNWTASPDGRRLLFTPEADLAYEASVALAVRPALGPNDPRGNAFNQHPLHAPPASFEAGFAILREADLGPQVTFVEPGPWLNAPWGSFVLRVESSGTLIDPDAIHMTVGGVEVEDAVRTGASPVEVSFTAHVAEGAPRTVTVTATDRAGRTRVASRDYQVDLAPPLVTAQAPANGTVTSSQTPTLRVDFEETLSGVPANGVRFLLTGPDGTLMDLAPAVQTETMASAAAPLPLGSGQWTVRAVVVDRAGNEASPQYSSFFVDAVGPTFGFESPANEAALRTVPDFIRVWVDDSIAGVDPDSIHMELDEVDVTVQASRPPGTGFVSLAPANLAEGVHHVRVTAADRVGNPGAAGTGFDWQFTYDATPPTVTFTEPGPGAHVWNARPTLRVAVSDAVSGVAPAGLLVRLDEAPINDWSYAGGVVTLVPGEDLAAGEHALYVRAEDPAGNATELPASQSTFIVHVVAPLTAPGGVACVAGDGLLTISWEAAPEEQGVATYRIFQRTSAGGANALLADVAHPGTSFVHSPVPNCIRRYYVVQALRANGEESPLSEEVSGRPEGPPPAVPTGFTLDAGNRRVRLAWTSNTEPTLKDYVVRRSTEAGQPGDPIAAVAAPATSYVDQGGAGTLTNGTTYYYAIEARNRCDTASGPTAQLAATPFLPAPAHLHVTVATSSTITLAWDAYEGGGLSAIRVFRSTESGTEEAPAVVELPGTATTWTDPNCVLGTSYFYVICGVAPDEAATETASSNEAVGSPRYPPPSLDASNVRKTNDPTPRVTGAATAGAHILVHLPGQIVGEGDANGEGHFDFQLAVSLADGPHYLSATALATGIAVSESLPSNSRRVTIDTTPPDSPTGVTAVPGPNFVDVHWRPSFASDLLGYNIWRSLDGETFTKLNDRLVVGTQFRDSTALNGTTYRYRVTAVDDTVREQ